MSQLLSLPNEILELILARYLAGLEISVRYSRRRINTRKVQNGVTILLVCRFIHNLAKPILFELVTFGHHAKQLLRDPADPLSLVLRPADLPMDKFLHVCFDFEYASNLVKVSDFLWPWLGMKSLKLVDYHGPSKDIVASDFLQKLDTLTKLQEICGLRDIHFTAYLPLGSKDHVRLSLTNSLSTLVGHPQLHSGPQPIKTIFRLPEMYVIPLGARSVVLSAVDNVTQGRADSIFRWFRDTAEVDCSYDHGLD